MKNLLKNLSTLLISIILCLLILEGIIRIFWINPPEISSIGYIKFVDNPKTIYENVPGYSVHGSIFNKQGYKDFDFVTRKPEYETRIIMLGDSLTAGKYVTIEDTFSQRLENILNQKAGERKIPTRYNVMNFGVEGYNLGAYLETLKTKALQYAPDIVILNLFFNDVEPIPNLWWFFIDECGPNEEIKMFVLERYFHEGDSHFTALKIRLLRRSRLFLFIASRVWTLRNKMETLSFIKNRFEKQGGIFDAGDAWIIRNFKELVKLKDQYNFKILICIHSFLNDSEHPVNDRFEYISKQFGLPYFKTLEYYRRAKLTKDSLVTDEDPNDICHPNELGHEIIAKAMFEELLKHNLIAQNLSK